MVWIYDFEIMLILWTRNPYWSYDLEIHVYFIIAKSTIVSTDIDGNIDIATCYAHHISVQMSILMTTAYCTQAPLYHVRSTV